MTGRHGPPVAMLVEQTQEHLLGSEGGGSVVLFRYNAGGTGSILNKGVVLKASPIVS